ncbi:MAG: glycoside hydrolase family 1 protein [Candidatus Rokubacteria bacterium]|nr:glycoside hydrolase family 1 protein [Candidatus Rokubacteria bacterium]
MRGTGQGGSPVFPETFLWGAATSAHQVEGHNVHSDWWAWEAAGRVRERSARSSDHYEQFEADFDLAKRLHHTTHRLSLEWSRLEPEPGRWDEQAIAHYQDVIRALRERDLEPIVTLFHFTSPRWFSEQGGWRHPGAMGRFRRYVERVLDAIGPSVRYWLTFNEPAIYVYQGYVAGVWPPGQRSWPAASRVLERLLHAHTMAYHLIHTRLDGQGPPPSVGFAKHMVVFSPCNPRSHKDRLATWVRHSYFNGVIAESFERGHLLPRLQHVFQRTVHRRYLDFIGLNYYTRDFVHFKGWSGGRLFGEICSLAHHRDAGARNSLGWEVYPEGIYECLTQLSRAGLPILVTENGICTADEAERPQFIHDHLAQVARAMEEGVPVLGYLYWSLLDNFEWHEGFAPRFGLIEVDYATLARRIRPSAEYLARVAQTGCLEMTGGRA